MTHGILLDTSILIPILEKDEKVIRWMQPHIEKGFYVSVITLAEVYQGYYYSSSVRIAEKFSFFESFIREPFSTVLEVTAAIAQEYGRLQGTLLKKGKPMGMFDGLIAATAISHNFLLVTQDRGFKAVPDLSLKLL